MKKYFVELVDARKEDSDSFYTSQFFDTLQEAIDCLDRAKENDIYDYKYASRKERQTLKKYGYGLVIDVPESEREDGEDDEELMARIDVFNSRYTPTDDEYAVLAAHNYEWTDK